VRRTAAGPWEAQPVTIKVSGNPQLGTIAIDLGRDAPVMVSPLRLLGPDRIQAVDWKLTATVAGNEIRWSNGEVWRRSP
jgi:hypothetical protein